MFGYVDLEMKLDEEHNKKLQLICCELHMQENQFLSSLLLTAIDNAYNELFIYRLTKYPIEALKEAIKIKEKYTEK